MSQRILQALLKTASHDKQPKFLIELAKPTQKKKKFKKCPTARQKTNENKQNRTQKSRQTEKHWW